MEQSWHHHKQSYLHIILSEQKLRKSWSDHEHAGQCRAEGRLHGKWLQHVFLGIKVQTKLRIKTEEGWRDSKLTQVRVHKKNANF